MAKRRRTFLDNMGVSPETQAEVHEDFNRGIGIPIGWCAELLMNPLLQTASLASIVVCFISYVGHLLGYFYDRYMIVILLFAGLPLFYLFVLLGSLAVMIGYTQAAVPKLKEDIRRNRQ